MELLLRDMKSGTSKQEAMDKFLQLEEQLRALHQSVRAMDGGFRRSNKVSIHVHVCACVIKLLDIMMGTFV